MADLTSYVAILISIIAVIPLYIDLIGRKKERQRIEFELETYYEEDPNDRSQRDRFGIRVLHPSRSIDHCKITFNDTKLPFWDSNPDYPDYDRKIPQSGGANVWIPKELFPPRYVIPDKNAVVKVWNGRKLLREEMYGAIPRVD